MKVQIERLDHQGRGITKVEGITTFIPNALIGEIVEIEIIQKKKKYNIGKVVKYIEQSPKRVKPICPYFEKCGGCDLMHMSYPEQLQFKKNKIENIIERYTSLDKNIVKDILYGTEYNYRNKVTFQVKNQIGFYDKKSNDIIPITYCYLASKNINEILSIFTTCNLKNVDQIMVRSNNKDNMVVIHSKKITNEIIEKLKEKSFILQYDQKYQLISGQNHIVDQIGNYQFIISPDSFYQVNSNMVEKLYQQVLQYLQPQKKEIVLDLYSGTGTIGIYISSHVKKVISVEINPYAVEDAKKNRELNHVENIEFICDDVANVIDQFKQKIDSIIVDPPRSGLDEKTIHYLKQINPNKIVYVSCDPITLARDLERLSDIYSVKEVTPVDMFPNTSHVECVSVLRQKN